MIGLTLGRYLIGRFFEMILVIFLGITALTFLIDFVELLRRASDSTHGAGYVALMALFRAPAASEQVLPFAVLFGSMATFVNLTRKLELVVARASGVSVWGFLVPPLLLALALGVISTTVFNPMAAALKQRADEMEVELFGRTGSTKDSSIWLRTRTDQGSATIRAQRVADRGARLDKVIVYVADRNDNAIEQVEAPSAVLTPGAWRLSDATVLAAGKKADKRAVYLLPTDMTRQDVLRALSTPDAVAFWDLPAFADRLAKTGLDPTPYRLKWDALLARPLQLVAMVLIAAAFSLRFFRFGGVGKTAAGGVAAGFMLYVVSKIIGDLGAEGLISPAVAAWSPAVVGSLLGALALLYQEDG
ncbi:MAG: LPS export ABC transporter permease LptG [Hyphomicrobiales bacterium]|nr:LPS export ABC transporter permease LptG [Hyphomicrobiales bacterium]